MDTATNSYRSKLMVVLCTHDHVGQEKLNSICFLCYFSACK